MRKDTGNSLRVRSSGRVPQGGQPSDKEPANAQASHRFLWQSDCPGPVMGKHPNFLQPAVVTAEVSLALGSFSLFPCAFFLAALQRTPDTFPSEDRERRAVVQPLEAGRVGTERPGPPGKAQKLLEAQWLGYRTFRAGRGHPRPQPVQSLHFAAGTPKPAK